MVKFNAMQSQSLLMSKIQELQEQNAQLRAALERLINVPAKDTKAVDEAWDLARQVLADSGGMET